MMRRVACQQSSLARTQKYSSSLILEAGRKNAKWMKSALRNHPKCFWRAGNGMNDWLVQTLTSMHSCRVPTGYSTVVLICSSRYISLETSGSLERFVIIMRYPSLRSITAGCHRRIRKYQVRERGQLGIASGHKPTVGLCEKRKEWASRHPEVG